MVLMSMVSVPPLVEEARGVQEEPSDETVNVAPQRPASLVISLWVSDLNATREKFTILKLIEGETLISQITGYDGGLLEFDGILMPFCHSLSKQGWGHGNSQIP